MPDLQELMVGSTRIAALKDGELTLPKEILLNIDENTTKKLSDENSQLTNSQINAYLIFKNEKILLVDTGCRDLFGPTCGFVHEEIAKANVNPEDITDIFFTHLHPDHVGGSINKDGEAIFPNATVNIIEEELNFWSKDDFEDVEINGKNMADLNKSVIKAYGEKVKTIKTNEEIILNDCIKTLKDISLKKEISLIRNQIRILEENDKEMDNDLLRKLESLQKKVM